MNTVKVENCKTLFIGRRGENEVTEVVFDFSEWQEQFGAGVIDLYVKRSVDFDAYPVVLSIDGTVATWIVTDADTAVVGSGKIEFVYTVDQKVAKSAIFPFYVGEDIGQASSEPPDPYESWIETLTELGTETQANAQAAAQSASDAADSAASASESAGQAEDSAEDAEAWAVGERDGEPVSAGDETYENNAKYWAENARENAPVQSVNGKDGNVELTLDDIPNGETFARATPEQLAQIGKNADDIADIDAMIPSITSESNHLVNVSFLTNRLTSYRTSAAQDAIDAGKQSKITAYGILKRDRSGNITAAIAGADYVTADALNSYRKATAQDAIDNAQDQNINKNTAAINTMQPAATAADIGKALIVKAVENGKPSAYEYGEAGGGGGSALTAGDGLEISNDVISNTQGIEYIVGTQTAATSKWTGVSTDETLKVGKIIAYYLPFAGTSTVATLALTMADGTTTREISLQLKPNATVTTQFPAGSIIILVYDGSYWRVNASYDTDTNTNPTGYCLTNGSVAAKTAACSFGYRGDTNYFPCLFRFANTATDATLAITTYAPEAAPIYVNGQRTSATNTFSAGVILFLYYNGAYYCYNDGRFPILVNGAVTSVQEYAAGLLADYRTAAAQDTIDAGKQAKITASGILKGDGAGGVSAAVAGVDYLKSAPVTSVNGQTGDVTIQTATDAQVTTAVNTWLGENVVQETGYVLDASLTMSNAAPPASAVGDLKSALNGIDELRPITVNAEYDQGYRHLQTGCALKSSTSWCTSKMPISLNSGDSITVTSGYLYQLIDPVADNNGAVIVSTTTQTFTATNNLECYIEVRNDTATSVTPAQAKLAVLIQHTSAIVTKVNLTEKKVDDIAVISKNLFNKNDVVEGEYVKYSDGTFQTNQNFWRSAFIPVQAGNTYTLRYINQLAFYTGTHTYISGVNGYSANTSANPSTVTAPNNAEYIVICGHNSQLSSDQLELGNSFTGYEDYGYVVKQTSTQKFERISDITSSLVFANDTIKIKLLGDSTTAGQGGTGYTNDASHGELILTDPGYGSYYTNPGGYCWANLLKAYFEAHFNCTVTNYGCSGMRVHRMVQYLDELIENDDDIVIFMGGLNDRNDNSAHTDLQTLASEIQSIIDYCRSRDKSIIIMSPVPTLDNETGTKNYKTDDIDHAYMELSNINRMEYISVFQSINSYCLTSGTPLSSLLNSDNVHPNDEGYRIMYYAICSGLQIGVYPATN